MLRLYKTSSHRWLKQWILLLCQALTFWWPTAESCGAAETSHFMLKRGSKVPSEPKPVRCLNVADCSHHRLGDISKYWTDNRTDTHTLWAAESFMSSHGCPWSESQLLFVPFVQLLSSSEKSVITHPDCIQHLEKSFRFRRCIKKDMNATVLRLLVHLKLHKELLALRLLCEGKDHAETTPFGSDWCAVLKISSSVGTPWMFMMCLHSR